MNSATSIDEAVSRWGAAPEKSRAVHGSPKVDFSAYRIPSSAESQGSRYTLPDPLTGSPLASNPALEEAKEGTAVSEAAVNPPWDKAKLKECLEIAQLARDPLLAVMTIIRNKHQHRKRPKGKPIKLGNDTMEELGFKPIAKIRALKKLEAWGFVKVEWRERKAPLITVLRPF